MSGLPPATTPVFSTSLQTANRFRAEQECAYCLGRVCFTVQPSRDWTTCRTQRVKADVYSSDARFVAFVTAWCVQYSPWFWKVDRMCGERLSACTPRHVARSWKVPGLFSAMSLSENNVGQVEKLTSRLLTCDFAARLGCQTPMLPPGCEMKGRS
jgi:hypothetical protein